jgi:hypothetical protein
MNKLAWVGVAVVAAVFLFVAWMYFALVIDHRPPPGKQINNTTTSRTANTTPTVTVVKPPFNASAYEVNYTFVFTVSMDGIAVTMDGWMVIGVGPEGNYSFGIINVPLHDVAMFKSATEGNATYTMTCLHGYCEVKEEKWPFSGLIEGINATKIDKGQCRRLNYIGTLYEERGMLDIKAFYQFVGNLAGNYTAYICEVNGVVLSADLTAASSVQNETVHITLKMEAVKAGPYSVDTYRLILKEIKAANQ